MTTVEPGRNCSATGGTFTLSFRGQTTNPIQFNALLTASAAGHYNAGPLENELEALSTYVPQASHSANTTPQVSHKPCCYACPCRIRNVTIVSVEADHTTVCHADNAGKCCFCCFCTSVLRGAHHSLWWLFTSCSFLFRCGHHVCHGDRRHSPADDIQQRYWRHRHRSGGDKGHEGLARVQQSRHLRYNTQSRRVLTVGHTHNLIQFALLRVLAAV